MIRWQKLAVKPVFDVKQCSNLVVRIYVVEPVLNLADVNYLLDVLTQKKQKLEAVSVLIFCCYW